MGYNSGITTMGGRAGGGARSSSGGGGTAGAGKLPRMVSEMFDNTQDHNISALVRKGERYVRYDKGIGKIGTFSTNKLDTNLKSMIRAGRRVGIIENSKPSKLYKRLTGKKA